MGLGGGRACAAREEGRVEKKNSNLGVVREQEFSLAQTQVVGPHSAAYFNSFYANTKMFLCLLMSNCFAAHDLRTLSLEIISFLA